MTNPNSSQININGNVSGSTIIIGDKNTVISSKEQEAEDFSKLISNAKNYLYNADYEQAYEILSTSRDDFRQSGILNLLTALATIAGRSFNAMPPSHRESAEKDLLLARQKLGGNNIISSIILAILEIDYYNYHGRISKNKIDIETLSQQVGTMGLNEEDMKLINSLYISQDAKKQLNLTSN